MSDAPSPPRSFRRKGLGRGLEALLNPATRPEGAEPVLKRWVGTDVTTSPKVQKELQAFFEQHGVKSVAMSEGNMGCPHEEGEDFPHGEDCPFCPFWKGRQGSNRKD